MVPDPLEAGHVTVLPTVLVQIQVTFVKLMGIESDTAQPDGIVAEALLLTLMV